MQKTTLTRILGILLTAILLTGALSILPVSADEIIPGDVDSSGGVDISDARLVLQHLVGKISLTKDQRRAADVNANGKVDIGDARLILQHIVGKPVELLEGGVVSMRVGISLPTRDLQRWNEDGANMKQAFENLGYQVELQYANFDYDGITLQIEQIRNMIANDCDVLIVASYAGWELTDVLAKAKAKNIPVIAYGSTIVPSDVVSYYIPFDLWEMGRLQGQYIADALDLKNANGPLNIEFFTGDPGDNNINFFYGGAMEILRPYLNSGKLVCKSGETEITHVATVGWSSQRAQERMEYLISANNYGPDKVRLDAVLCSNDSTAQGVIEALKGAGYTTDNIPVITGLDCDITAVKRIILGLQSMSLYWDSPYMCECVIRMADEILQGKPVTVNGTVTIGYGEWEFTVPAYKCRPLVVTKDNYKEVLIDSGYYTEDDLVIK
ncbi:MAG: substrate-binding domain-containing protein [Oscillospiraceae bacterium]|nr:substrate-binding domain-containing protein [Oscillospiraceae bacterium]